MKIETAKLSEAALDWAVAKAEGEVNDLDDFCLSAAGEYEYSTKWAIAGPIISRADISIVFRDSSWAGCQWSARIYETNTTMEGPTPLIAAMRCFVASKIGYEVDIPDELCNVVNRAHESKTEIKVGTKFQNVQPVLDDDEYGQERITPPGSTGEITSIDIYPGQGFTYGFCFSATGAAGYLLESELRDTNQFLLDTPEPQVAVAEEQELSEYMFDVKLFATVRVKANSWKEAEGVVREVLDGAIVNAGCWPDGNPVLFEASIDGALDLIEIDGEPTDGDEPENDEETLVEYGVNIVKNGVGENPFDENFPTEDEALVAAHDCLRRGDGVVRIFRLEIAGNTIVKDETIRTLTREEALDLDTPSP